MSNCELCGEPMAPGEGMFKFHGYSGPCPKPPTAKAKREAFLEYIKVDEVDGTFGIEIIVQGEPKSGVCGFATAAERDRALDDLLSMMRSLGAKQGPAATQ